MKNQVIKNQEDWVSIIKYLFDTDVEIVELIPGSLTFKLPNKLPGEAKNVQPQFEEKFNQACSLGFEGTLKYDVSSSLIQKQSIKISPTAYRDIGKLFGSELILRLSQYPLLRNVGFNPQYVTENLSYDKKNPDFITSKAQEADEELRSVMTTHVSILKKLLTQISITELASLLTQKDGKGFFNYKLPNSTIKNEILEGAFRQICDVTKDGQFYFDGEALKAYLKAPRLEFSKEDTTLCTLNTDDFLRFLACRFPEKFLVTDSKEGEQLVCFAPPKETKQILLPKHLMLMLDCSGSMRDGFRDYLNKVETLIDNFAQAYQGIQGQACKVTLISFSNKESYVLKEFDLTNPYALSAISFHLKTLMPGGGTYLEGSILRQLTNLDSFNDEHTSVVIFTDGQDTSSSAEEKKSLESKIKDFDGQENRPQIFIAGLGSAYDPELAKKLIDRTNGELIEIEKDNLQKILDSLSSEKFKKDYLFFTLKKDGLKDLLIPVESGTIKNSGFQVPIGEKFTVNQNTYTISRVEPKETEIEKPSEEQLKNPGKYGIFGKTQVNLEGVSGKGNENSKGHSSCIVS